MNIEVRLESLTRPSAVPSAPVQSPASTIAGRLDAAVALMRDQLRAYRDAGKSICASSSFQTHSIPLLHLLAVLTPGTPVYFIDTGFHFPETLAFRDQVAAMLGLNLVNLRSRTPLIMQRDRAGVLLCAADPDRCCWINKTQPMEEALAGHDVWVSGLRRDQSAYRRGLAPEMPGPNETVRFHPMLDWDTPMICAYRRAYDLPEHPLDAAGYPSVGCEPCTSRFLDGDTRDGRWAGLAKSECGLHTELIGRR